jgi:hypothetical protein
MEAEARQTAMVPAAHPVRHSPGVPLAGSRPRWCSPFLQPNPAEWCHLPSEPRPTPTTTERPFRSAMYGR